MLTGIGALNFRHRVRDLTAVDKTKHVVQASSRVISEGDQCIKLILFELHKNTISYLVDVRGNRCTQ